MAANDTQVAGDHYNKDGDVQHWDVAAKFDLDYFQGQITKYVFRWKHKHATPAKRLEDLKKARHFLDKYIELNEVVAVQAAPVTDYMRGVQIPEVYSAPMKAYWMGEEVAGFTPLVRGRSSTTWQCQHCQQVLEYNWRLDPRKEHACGAEPTPEYVNQG